MAIAGGTANHSKTPTPCGRCRQIILEASHVSQTDIQILLTNHKHEEALLTTIKQLLPIPFGPEDLNLSEKLERFRK